MRKQFLAPLYCLMFLCLALSTVEAQQTFKTTTASVIGYLEYVPQGYNTNSDKYPVVIFLHGIGERGVNSTDPAVLSTTINDVAVHGPPMHVKNGTQFPFILISPQLKGNFGSWSSSYVMEVINHIKTYLRIDERRIYLTGLSLGGGGTWVTAQDYPALFAAIAPVCGGYNTVSKACNLASENLPVWAFHGDIDTVVPMSRSVNMVNAINNCTPTPSLLAKMTIYNGVGHNAWSKAYRTDHSVHDPNVYEWIQSYTNTSNNGNKVPIANAGADLSVSLATAALTGSGTDADGTIASYSWTQLSGPTVTLTNKLTRSLAVSGLISGTYMFRLTVTDNSGNTDSDYVKLTVGTIVSNVAPVASAGVDKSITLPTNTVTIIGNGTDSDGTIASYSWSKVSGGAAALSGITTTNLVASSLTSGSYVFRLTVTDNKGATKSDEMTLTVNGSSTTNITPVANAGIDKSITLPTNAIDIAGTGTDPDGTITYYKWSKVSGPTSSWYNVSKPTVSVYNMRAGTYIFKLVVTDNKGASDEDEVTIIVRDAVIAAASFSAKPVNTVDANTSLDNQTILGDMTRADLENATVVIFNDGGEKIYTGSWDAETYNNVLNSEGLYIYNVIKEGRRLNAGKIYVRD